MIILKHIYYFFYDLLIIVRNLKKDKNFIILFPRIFAYFLKFTLIYDKINKKTFFQYVRNKYDLITVHEIFGEESYNLKKYLIWEQIEKTFNKILIEKKVPLVIDCGSNISCSTEYFCRVFKNIFPILIEPNTDSSSFGKKNLTIKNFILLNSPISYETKIVKFDDTLKDNRASKISKTKGKEISTITISEILKNHETKIPFIIKIDIEGYEKDLFKSNFEWLNSFKIVIIEIHDWMIPGEGVSFNLFKAINSLTEKRDVIISGENLIFVKTND